MNGERHQAIDPEERERLAEEAAAQLIANARHILGAACVQHPGAVSVMPAAVFTKRIKRGNALSHAHKDQASITLTIPDTLAKALKGEKPPTLLLVEIPFEVVDEIENPSLIVRPS